MIRIECGDCIEVMRPLPDDSVDLIATDPPYFKVKNEPWDRAWDKPEAFLAWLDEVAAEWFRLLKPNGSLYCFASSRMAARVEVLLGRRFNVLNRIRWIKTAGWHNKTEKEAIRSYLSPWEEIIFAEHRGAECWAKGESGYASSVFSPIRDYLIAERDRAGIRMEEINRWLGFSTNGGMAYHYFKPPTSKQWQFPTREHYEALRRLFNRNQPNEHLRREYEDLRREYEDLRRPFSVTADVPYTDVWDFPTVQAYRGKHPCEKPLEMMQHIIRASSRLGATVLDCFAGSGVVGQAAKLEGRSAILIERDPQWAAKIHDRLKIEQPVQHRVSEAVGPLPLFGGQAA